MAPIPMRRGASPAQISTFVVFLVSDESSYATAAEFVRRWADGMRPDQDLAGIVYTVRMRC
jgi:NAD(P)-dependent dehydrogenase (short-subunit alcohol dehydrogenase family)